MQIWTEEINAKGGLLGRQVKLKYYDDQSNPALVPGIISKLLDVDKVDLLIGGNGTNVVAPALPVVMQRNLTLIGLVRPRRELASFTIRGISRSFRPAASTRARRSRKASSPSPRAQTPKPADDRAGRRRRGIPEERAGGRAVAGETNGSEDRLRSDLSADDLGLFADRARDPGDQSRSGVRRRRIRRTPSA